MSVIQMRFSRLALLCAIVLLSSGSILLIKLQPAAARPQPTAPPISRAERNRLWQSYGQLPLRFEANRGQTGAGVQFMARGSGYTLFLTGPEAVLKLQPTPSESNAPAVLRLKLRGARHRAPVSAAAPLEGQTHYLRGNRPQAWQTQVPGYARVKYANVYPGIDLVWHGQQRQLEYDFLLAPGARPARIRLAFSGAQTVKLDAAGALVLQTPAGSLRLLKPQAWQERAGRRRAVACAYRLKRKGEVGFTLGAYDHRWPLVIDPVLIYSTYLGGLGTDQAFGIAVDGAGNAYITGSTDSADFPGASALQAAKGAQTDAFVIKLNAAGTGMLYGTWLGGAGADSGRAIAVDAAGNAYVTGVTGSPDFPVKNAPQPTRKGGEDAFLFKLDPSGSQLLYGTYLGGMLNDRATALALDAAGNTWLTGYTDSFDFPLANARQTGKRGSAVYLSTDNGASWTGRAAGLNVSQVYELAVDPKNPLAIYASTEQGLYKTTDGGAGWQRLAAQQAFLPLFTQIVIDPANTNILYAVSNNIGYKSVNGGASWELLPGLPSDATLALAPVTPTTLYAASKNSSIVLISTDGGATWQRGGSLLVPFGGNVNGINAIAIDPLTPATLYVGTNQGIFKSTNSGATFTQQFIGFVSSQQPRLDKLAISRSNPAVIYAALAFGSGLIKTVNGGASWTDAAYPAGLASPQTLRADPEDANNVYLGGLTGLYKTTDGGATWRSLTNPFGGLSVRAVAFTGGAPGRLLAGANSGTDAFIAKVNAAGTTLLYSTYLGGSGNDYGAGLGVDVAGNVCVTGQTQSADMPAINAYQGTLKGVSDAFAAKLNADGASFAWLTYLGGSGNDSAFAMALNNNGNLFVAGTTQSTDFPVVNAYQATLRSTPNNGPDGFVARFSTDGRKLDYATYLGGNDIDDIRGLAVDADGNAYMTGQTLSTDFPVLGAPRPDRALPSLDAFVARLSSDGRQLGFAQYLGGTSGEIGLALALDAAGAVYVTGYTGSDDFPATPGAAGFRGRVDAFVTKLGLRADLALTMTDLPDPVQVNGTLNYTLTVTNRGPDGAEGVTVSDTLPAGVTFVAATASSGACSGSGPVNCALGALPAGGSATVNLAVRPTATGMLTNRATVAAATADDNPANNAATQETRVSTLPGIFGRVTASNSAGVSDVTISLTGAARPAVTTGGDGAYQFTELVTELASGSNLSVTPARAGFVFTPPNRSFTNLTTDQRADFTATACVFTLAPASQVFQASGGAGTLTINSPDARCAWTARSNASWLKLTAASSGNGTATVSYSVEPTVSARAGTLTVAGQPFSVRQEFNACPAVEFATAPFFPLSNAGRFALEVGDFNGDGRADAVFVAEKANGATGISLSLANARGGYAPPISALPDVNLPLRYRASLAADFNSDGKLDLAVAVGTDNGSNGRVALAFGDGAGNFAAPVNYTVNGAPFGLTTADFNGDGQLDLVSASSGAGTPSMLALWLNQGRGVFAAARPLTLQNDDNLASQLAAGDFTQDGRPDLVLLTSNRRLVLLRNNLAGGGSLDALPALNVDGSVVAAGDFTGDGKLDVATGDSQLAQIWRGDGNGGFERGAQIRLPDSNTWLYGEDMNGDGRTDLVIASFQRLGVFYAARGGFEPLRSFHPGVLPSDALGALRTGDADGDGRRDLFFLGTESRFTSSYGLGVLSADGTGGFVAARIFEVPGTSGLSSGDLNGDGNVDVGALRTGFSSIELVVTFGDGRGGFGAPVSYSLNASARVTAMRDFNGDGLPDIAVLNAESGGLTILFNDGKGQFPRRNELPGNGAANTFGVADFNRDGQADLLVKGRAGLTLLTGNGNGTFTEAASSLAANFSAPYFTTGDFNGDGNADAVVFDIGVNCRENDASPVLLYGNGRGGFGAPQPVAPTLRPEYLTPLSPSDLNGDGRTDLVLSNVPCSAPMLERGTYALLAAPQGGFGVPLKLSALTGRHAVGDLNGDAIPDVLYGDGGVTQLGSGDGTFAEAPQSQRLPASNSLALADLNRDGTLDVLSIPNQLTVSLNRSQCLPPNGLVQVSAASYARHRAASESIAALFGAGLANRALAADALPLPTTLGGVSVRFKDSAGIERAAPLFFVSPTQINHLIPAGTAPGVALLTVQNGAQTVASGTTLIEPVAPSLFTADTSGTGLPAAVILRVKADGTQVYEAIAQFNAAQRRFIPLPIEVGNPAEQVILLLFGTGWRGAGASVAVRLGGEAVPVLFAGTQGGLVGLDQLNLRLPPSLQGRGASEIVLTTQGQTANPVNIVIK